MTRRTAILVLTDHGPLAADLGAALQDDADQLAVRGVHVAHPDDVRRAEHDLLRTHRAAGLRRRDVDGAWAGLCRRAWRRRGTTLVVSPELVDATDLQAALLLDALAGLRVHVVVLTQDHTSLAGRLARWSPRISSGAVHVVTVPRWGAVAEVRSTLAGIGGYDAPVRPEPDRWAA